jgi:hypothetical protein
VNDCNHVEFKTLVEVAVVPTVVRRICPEAAPLMTIFELPGAIAMAVIEPPVCWASLVRAHEVAELVVRHIKRPPIHRLAGLFGSILKTVMKGKASPLMPDWRMFEKLAPPFVERRMDKLVVSRKRVFVFVGLTAT